MTKADMITRLQQHEAITYAHMTKALTMFGESSQPYLLAQARWETVYGVLAPIAKCGVKPVPWIWG